MGRKWAMVVDISKCIACYACFVACKDEFWNNDYLPYSLGIKKREQTLIRLEKRERGGSHTPRWHTCQSCACNAMTLRA